MGVYKTAIITTAGQSLIAQALAGNSAVKFTSLKTSNYSYAASTNFETLTSLQGIKQSAGITSAIVVNQTTVKISARVSNVGITSAYYINTIGVYAETDGITETLIAVIPASTADLVPAYSTDAPYSFIYDINLTIQNSTSLNVTINDSGVATVADLRHFFEKTYDVYVTDTASGEIALFEDGADKIPMESVNVSMTPRQSFNGYDKPWPAGGGKNLLSITVDGIKAANTSGTWSGNAYTYRGVTFSVLVDSGNNVTGVNTSGTANDGVVLVLGSFNAISGTSYTINGSPSGKSDSTYRLWGEGAAFPAGNRISDDRDERQTATAAATESTPIALQIFSGVNVNGLTFYPMVRLASDTDATFAPYANICPISGWNAVKVTRTGFNLWNKANAEYGYVSNTAGTIQGSAEKSSIHTGYIEIIGGEAYCFTTDQTNTGGYGAWYDSNKNFVNGFIARGAGSVITAPINAKYCRYTVRYENYGTVDTCCISISDPAKNGTYEPYTGNNIYAVTFPSDIGTVYGGTVDIANGKLTVTDANIVSYNGETLPGEWLSSYDKYAEGATPTTGAQVVYKLATSQTIQLSPTEIDSLYGYNNVWSDVGDVTVKYRADTTLYIDKKIAEMQALILENS